MKVIDAVSNVGAWVQARIAEPSSGAGIAALVGAAGLGVPVSVVQGAFQAASALFGLVAIVRKEVAAVQGKDGTPAAAA